MSKRLILILAFAFVVGLSLTAYAEVQNVKVSGDLTVVGALRENLDLVKSGVSMPDGNVSAMAQPANAPGASNAANYRDSVKTFATITRLRVDADLTDNVIATVRLLNERDWNGEGAFPSVANNNIGLNSTNNEGGRFNQGGVVNLDLAYATIKEFLYSPLTLKVGRQEMSFQNGWLIGDPDTNVYSAQTSLAAGDLSAHKAFDAIRATLDYNPLVVDLVYGKAAQGVVTRPDGITFAGVNAAYELDKTTTLEGFVYYKSRGKDSPAAANVYGTDFTNTTVGAMNQYQLAYPGNLQENDVVNTLGARVVNRSINNLTLDVMGAVQYGLYNPKFDPNARFVSVNPADRAESAHRKAFGAEAVAIYDLKDIAAIAKYHPMVMAAFVYLSGSPTDRVGSKAYTGWDPMFENQTFGHLTNAMFGFSNIRLWGLSMSAKPMDDITTKLDWSAAWFNKLFTDGRMVNLSGVSGARTFTMAHKSFAGHELDMTVTYDYTEDVQFSLLGGVYFTGGAISKNTNDAGRPQPGRANASELIGSMKVTF